MFHLYFVINLLCDNDVSTCVLHKFNQETHYNEPTQCDNERGIFLQLI